MTTSSFLMLKLSSHFCYSQVDAQRLTWVESKLFAITRPQLKPTQTKRRSCCRPQPLRPGGFPPWPPQGQHSLASWLLCTSTVFFTVIPSLSPVTLCTLKGLSNTTDQLLPGRNHCHPACLCLLTGCQSLITLRKSLPTQLSLSDSTFLKHHFHSATLSHTRISSL